VGVGGGRLIKSQKGSSMPEHKHWFVLSLRIFLCLWRLFYIFTVGIL